jgi:hypothetical protein
MFFTFACWYHLSSFSEKIGQSLIQDMLEIQLIHGQLYLFHFLIKFI